MKPTLYLAPMQGVTNYIYRKVYSKMFDCFDYAMSPFLSGTNVTNASSKLFKDVRLDRNEGSIPLIPQILTNRASDFISIANLLNGMGYETVNLNLGCPNRMVRQKKRGSGFLPHTDEIVSFLEEVTSKSLSKVSVKLRLGLESQEELFRLLLRLDHIQLENIIIHPRTGMQEYKGSVDLDAFERALGHTTHKVIYNGDLNTLEQYENLKNRFPVIDSWMLGRGAVTDPFLAGAIKGEPSLSYEDKLLKYKELHDTIFEAYQSVLFGPSHLIGKMKELWFYWSQAFEKGHKLKLEISRVKKVDKYQSLIESFFLQSPKFKI